MEQETAMDQNKNKESIVTIMLLACNVLVFLIMELMGDTNDTEFMLKMGAAWPPYIMDGQYWRLLTSTFMHFGFEHIMNNMLVLVCAGPILEKALGHVKYLLLYLLAGVGGSTLSFLQMRWRQEPPARFSE